MNVCGLIPKIKRECRAKKSDIGPHRDLMSVLLKCDLTDKTKKDWHWLQTRLATAFFNKKLPTKERVEFAKLRERVLLKMAKWDVDSYFQYLEKNRPIDKQFYIPRREGLKPMIEGFQDLLDDKLDILAVSLPPRVGKTTASIFFLTMLMGLNPEGTLLASGHSGILTDSFYAGAMEVITSPDYTWGEIFPECFVAEKNSKQTTIKLNRPGRMKTLTCRSIDGTLTGACDANTLMYADDLVSGIEEALSKTRLDTLWGKYTSDLKARMVGKCKELHVATRWSVHDVIGRIEALNEGNDRARFIRMPALDENDHSLFHYSNGGGFDDAYYHERRNIMDDASWRALYMADPIEREGLLYPEQELQGYMDLPNREPDAVISMVDTKNKGKDFFVAPVAYVYGDFYYIEDCVCDDGVERLDAKTADLFKRHNVDMARVEANNAGAHIAGDIRNICRDIGCFTNIVTKFNVVNKETRIVTKAQWVKDHCLFKTKYAPRSDYSKFMKMLTSYTQSGKNKYDDVPDAMAGLADFALSMTGNRVKIIDNPLWGSR